MLPDGERDAASLDFPVWAPAPDRPEDQLVPATRYAIGDSLFALEAGVPRPGGPARPGAVVQADSRRDRRRHAGRPRQRARDPRELATGGVTVEQVAEGLRPLLDEPVEVVLPTHGVPAGRAALERALA